MRLVVPVLATATVAALSVRVQAKTINVVAVPGQATVPSSTAEFQQWGLNAPPGFAASFFGQTFTPPDAQNTSLTAFTFYLRLMSVPAGEPVTTYEALLWEYNSASALTTQPPKYKSDPMTLPNSEVGPKNGDYKALTTTFPSAIDLDPTKTYLLALHMLSGSLLYAFAYTNTDAYLGGQLLVTFNANEAGKPWYTAFGPIDFVFWATFAPFCDPTGVKLIGKTSRRSVRVVRPAGSRTLALKTAGKGASVRYNVVLANTNMNKTNVFGPAGLVIQLPANTTYVKGSVTPSLAHPSSKPDKTLSKPVYDAVANTVTWPDVPLAGGRKRKYTVIAKVQPTATSPLVFRATCPSCTKLATQSSVTVAGK